MLSKKIAFFTIIILSFFVINGLIHSIMGLWQKDQLIVSAEKELENEKQKNQLLKKQIAVVQKPQFIEEEARDKLFLVKPGEQVVIIPTISTKNVQTTVQNKQSSVKPNWQQWWELFF